MKSTIEAMKFRKKPVVIDAVQWTGENLVNVIRHTGLNVSASHFKWEDYEDLVRRDGLKIFTLEGKMSADIGDWIIKGVKGECYPCKPDIFKMTHEREEAQSVEPAAWGVVKDGKYGSWAYPVKSWAESAAINGYAVCEYFTHPAPAKPTMSAERESLISAMHMYAAGYPDSKHFRKAAQMLAADAQEIEDMGLNIDALIAKNKRISEAQQVAVPQVDDIVELLVTSLHHIPANEGQLCIDTNSMIHNLRAAAPRPPQAATRVPMTEDEIFEAGPLDDDAPFESGFENRIRFAEAHHSIGVNP